GLVDGQVGRGSFLAQPGTAAGGFNVFDGEPTEMLEMSLAFPPPQVSDALLQRTLAEIGRQPGAAQLLDYQPHAGMARHRAAGAAWIARHGLTVATDQVIVTAGAQHGLAVALGALLRPGDLLLTEALTYPGIRSAAELYRLRLKGVAMDADGLKP